MPSALSHPPQLEAIFCDLSFPFLLKRPSAELERQLIGWLSVWSRFLILFSLPEKRPEFAPRHLMVPRTLLSVAQASLVRSIITELMLSKVFDFNEV